MSLTAGELIEILRTYPEDHEVMVSAGPQGETICPIDSLPSAGYFDYEEESFYQDFSDDEEEPSVEDNNVVVLWTDNL